MEGYVFDRLSGKIFSRLLHYFGMDFVDENCLVGIILFILKWEIYLQTLIWDWGIEKLSEW